MWSEHCSYKSSRIFSAAAETLPTKAPWVIQGPGENAGVIDIGDGEAAIFKMESHNHPSFIEPYQGAATGVGGILRDVFTMGARPIANHERAALRRARSPKDAPPRVRRRRRHRRLRQLRRRADGRRRDQFPPALQRQHPRQRDDRRPRRPTRFSIRPPRASAIRSSMSAPRPAATASTARPWRRPSSARIEEKRPTVQVGDPFTEKLLIEACLELMATDAIIAIQDMGAAGLTSSSVEMADKGGVGIELDLDKVPVQREDRHDAYEMMLSESQERMLMVLKPGREAEAEAIFANGASTSPSSACHHRHQSQFRQSAKTRNHGPDRSRHRRHGRSVPRAFVPRH
jgi:hypothetical protein